MVHSTSSGGVAHEPADSVPAASATPASSSRARKIIADFQVCDIDGTVEIRQDHDGRVFTPDRRSHIGRYYITLRISSCIVYVFCFL